MIKGWFKIAKKKFIEERVYSFSIRRNMMFVGDFDEYGIVIVTSPVMSQPIRQSDWYYDIRNQKGFTQKFLYALELGKQKEFHFSYDLKKSKMAILN